MSDHTAISVGQSFGWAAGWVGGWVPGSTSPPPGVETSMAQACFLVPFLAL